MLHRRLRSLLLASVLFAVPLGAQATGATAAARLCFGRECCRGSPCHPKHSFERSDLRRHRFHPIINCLNIERAGKRPEGARKTQRSGRRLSPRSQPLFCSTEDSSGPFRLSFFNQWKAAIVGAHGRLTKSKQILRLTQVDNKRSIRIGSSRTRFPVA